jgi:uridine kinase
MRVALLISGYLRSFKSNFPNLKEKILDKFENLDVYIHITENEKSDDKYFNHIEDISTIKQKLNPICLLVEPNFDFTNEKDINNIKNNLSKFYKLNQIKKLNENSFGKYDLVIKYRPDLNLESDMDFTSFDGEKVYIPSDSKMDKNRLRNESDNFICDIFGFGDSESMDRYFDIFIHLDELIHQYGTVPETILYEYLNHKTIRYDLININYEVVLSECNVFAICGDSGSGKTRLGNRLKQFFSNSFMLECDRYHKWERGDENWGRYTHLNPEANYITKMNEDIFNLKVGNSIYQVDYDHKNGKFTEKNIIEASENTIVCGLHSLYDNDEDLYNLKIFIDTDEELKKKWKIERDVKERGHTLENVIKQIENRKVDFKKYILPQKYKSDFIIQFYQIQEELLLRLLIHKKFNLEPITKRLSEKVVDFELTNSDNENFECVSFYKYSSVDLWNSPSTPKFNDFYDYIIYFILNLK